MELTTLAAALLLALGLLTTDAVLHSGSVSVEVGAPLDVYRKVIDQQSLETVFSAQLDHIASAISMVNTPEIRSTKAEGIGMVLAESANLKPLAFALQRQIGYNPDRLRLALFRQEDGSFRTQEGALRAVVSGYGHSRGGFTQDFAPDKDEQLVTFIQRCAIWGASQLAPYTTALYVMQRHVGDNDFRDVIAIAGHALAVLPPAPLNEERAEFENLLGLVQLFRNDPRAARRYFDAAAAAWPDGPVPALNIAFTEIQLNAYPSAASRMRVLLDAMPYTTPTAVVATAHMTLAAALMGLRDFDGAEAELTHALRKNPSNSAAPELWAELKTERGDTEGAGRLDRMALQNASVFENYGELAALYFHLSWRHNEPVTRSKFATTGLLNLH